MWLERKKDKGTVRLTADFSTETMETGRQCNYIFKVLQMEGHAHFLLFFQ